MGTPSRSLSVSDDITGLCRDHSFETAIDVCRRCGLEFCEVCVVYPFGPKKPFCKECAMSLGGVRTQVTRNAQPSRLIRRRAKEFSLFVGRRKAPVTIGGAPDLVDPTIPDVPDPGANARERVPVPVPRADDAAFVDSLDTRFREAPLAAPAPGQVDPADGVAPPIDWSQPFG